ncbi:MAG: PEP-CTERM sorting domain-containing protein [Actinobacteria bacterium]|nr:PEP-CTERM sorting domain-containing protein [Actinomycetota bacterium]
MKRAFVILVSTMFLVAPGLAEAATWTFTKVVDTSTAIPGGGGNFTDFYAPSFDAGDVAFNGDGVSKSGIYTYIGGSLATVSDTSSPIPGGTGNFTLLYDPSLDGGGVAFKGMGSSGQDGIYTYIGGSLAKVADLGTGIPDGSGYFTSFGGFPSFDGGNVAFNGMGSSSQDGIYTYIGGSLAKVADTSSPIPGGTGNFTVFYDPCLDGGEVAFAADDGIYKTVASTLTKVADVNTPSPGGGANTFTVFYDPSFDGGEVAFVAEGSTADGIYTDVGGSLTLVASTNTAIPSGTGDFINFSGCSLDGGNVAFWAEGSSGQEGIYADLGGGLEKVVDLADTIDGKTIASLVLSNEGLSSNSIAFRARFSDNSEGIYIAIPEPASVLLLVLGLGLLVSRKRRPSI